MLYGNANLTISAKADDLEVAFNIMEEGVSVDSSSYGGFDVVDRPLRTGLVTFSGHQPLSLSVPGFFDYLVENDGLQCEKDILALENLAGRGDGAGGEPPEIVLKADGQLVPHADEDYVINGLEWGTVIYNPYGNRIKAEFTLTLLQNVRGTTLTKLSKKKQQKAQRSRTYVVKRGDSLQSIAQKQLGDRSRWDEIADLNKIHDDRSLPVGKKLRLPAVKGTNRVKAAQKK